MKLKIAATININNYMKVLLDKRKMHKLLYEGVFNNTLDELTKIVQAEMITHKRTLTPRVRTGFLARNIGYELRTSRSYGFYIGSVGVSNVVPYSRIHELGGIVKRQFKHKKGKRKYYTVEYPRRSYLRNPIYQFAVQVYKNELFELLSTLGSK